MDYRKMSAISGAIIFFSIAALMISIIWLAEKRIFFAPDYVVYVKFDDVVGLGDRSLVYMRGYRVGRTKDVEFLSDGVRVRVDINKKFRIPKDSRFEIHTLNFLGEKSITIQPGTSPILLQPREQVTGSNKDIVMAAQGILDEIKRKIATGDWDVKLRTLGDSLDKFHSLLEKSNQKLGQIDIATFNRNVQAFGDLTADLKTVSADLKREVTETGQAGRDGLAKVDRAVEQISSLTAKLDEIAGKIGRGEGSVGALVKDPTLVADLQSTLKELRTLVANISKNPKKYFKFSIF